MSVKAMRFDYFISYVIVPARRCMNVVCAISNKGMQNEPVSTLYEPAMLKGDLI